MNHRRLRTILITALMYFASNMPATANSPDFSICDGLAGAAKGLCRAGVAAGCADGSGNPTSCLAIEQNFSKITGEDAPWVVPTGSARLIDLSLTAGSLNPLFDPNVTSYNVSVSVLVSSIAVSATPEDGNAKVTVNGIEISPGGTSPSLALLLGSNILDVIVTSSDQVTTLTYTIDVGRQSIVAFSQKLTGGDAAIDDEFGRYLDVDGDTALIGSPGDDDLGSNSGSVYVFERSNSIWTEQQKLLASDGMPGDGFGNGVAIDNDTALVLGGGSAYAFTRSGGVWSEQQKFSASNGALLERVALDGSTAVFTANGSSGYTAHVFELIGNLWTEQQILTASDTTAILGSVALDGETLVIGHSEDDIICFNSGSAYVFYRTNGMWVEQTKLIPSDSRAESRFGNSVAVEDDTIVVGAYFDTQSYAPPPNCLDDFPAFEGAVYVFVRNGGTWQEYQKLIASDFDYRDEFGSDVALQGDTLVVSANDILGSDYVATGYVFVRDNGLWVEQHKMIPIGAPAVEFSQNPQIALDEGVAIIGSRTDINGGLLSGAAVVFEGL